MVSNYKRKTNKGSSYTKENFKSAVQAVKNGHLSGYQAAKIYNIPRMTIMDHVYNRRFKSTTLGRNTALSSEVETNLVALLHLMEKYGFGLSRDEVLELVGDYVKKNNLATPFKNGVPGKAWFAGFKTRHNLSIKKPQGVEYARKKAMDPFIVFPYFDLLWKTMNELNITDKPSAIWNLDETSFCKDPTKTKIVGIKGHAATRVISSPGRSNITVLLGASANGAKTPPLIIYKGKNIWDEWVSPDAYPGTAYAATKNGWMEAEVFETFFKKVFLLAVGDQRPILLIYDGHATHVGLNIIEEARKNDITIMKLPPHTSHVLQPLDLSVMKSFKDQWDPLLVKWQRLNVGVPLPKKEFARLIGNVWTQMESTILVNGFRKAGIFPWNPDEIKDTQYDALKLKKWKEVKAQSGRTEAVEVGIVTRNPPSLLSLALNIIRRDTSLNLSKTLVTPKKTLSQDQSAVPGLLNRNKIKILENVSFEELLLSQVKSGNNSKVKRQKMAPGAEVITNDDVVKRKQEEMVKNIKRGTEARKTKIEVRLPKSKNTKIQQKCKTQQKTSVDTLETNSSVDFNNPSHERNESNKENVPNTDEIDLFYLGPSTSTDIRHLSPTSLTGMKKHTIKQENIKQTRNNPKTKCIIKKRVKIESDESTSVSDCRSLHSDSDIYDCSEIFDFTVLTPSKTSSRLEIDSSVISDQYKEQKASSKAGDNETKIEKSVDLDTYNIGDNVMVRYYNRKKWTYYVGYIEKENDDEDAKYTVRFYKTVKKAKEKILKFILTKKIDRDDVPRFSIVKKVQMKNDPNNSKELLLSNCDDTIYFM